jgi:hypothetical protein
VNIPTPNTDINQCDLTGRYVPDKLRELYLELLVIPGSFLLFMWILQSSIAYEIENVEVHYDKNIIFVVSKRGLISSYATDVIEMNVITAANIEMLAHCYGQSEFGAGIRRHQKQQKSHIDC